MFLGRNLGAGLFLPLFMSVDALVALFFSSIEAMALILSSTPACCQRFFDIQHVEKSTTAPTEKNLTPGGLR